MQIEFADKMVTYDVFVRDIALNVVHLLKEGEKAKRDVISKRQAFMRYGRNNVERWERTGKLKPFSKRPGKIEYKVFDLEQLNNRQQDYFE